MMPKKIFICFYLVCFYSITSFAQAIPTVPKKGSIENKKLQKTETKSVGASYKPVSKKSESHVSFDFNEYYFPNELNNYGQTEDDNIAFIRVQNQISNSNYDNAISILNNNISDRGKGTPYYLSYVAICLERTNNIESATAFYKKLYAKTKSSKVMYKIASLQDKADDGKKKDEKKRNCYQCNGTGYYYADESCRYCDGTGSKNGDCSRCRGEGTVDCHNCKGTGKSLTLSLLNTLVTEGSSSEMVDCAFCSGTGKEECGSCGGTGKVSGSCSHCNGSGTRNVQKRCTLHD